MRRLPSEEFYGDYPLFEDGIGIVRSTVDDFAEAQKTGLDAQAARALEEAGLEAALLLGCAPKPYASALISQSALSGQVRALFVPNELFSGNVDVTGLLGGEDMVRAVREDAARRALREDAERGVRRLYLLPQVAFNADGVTLDGLSAEDIRAACGQEVQVAPSNPLDCMQHMIRYAEKR